VIKKPRERGGHSPRWAAEPEKIIINNNNNNNNGHMNTSPIKEVPRLFKQKLSL
jgi:hypothetical protein